MLKRLREIERLRRANPAETSFMRYAAARTGTTQGTIRDWWPHEWIAPVLLCAVVKAEDFCFTRHRGVAWEATIFSVAGAVLGRREVRAVSTITQQLARNLFLTPERRVSRKLREMLLAARLDRSLGKQRVLELYLNTAEWGEGIWGCSAATAHYLGKTPAEVNAFEALVLASLLPAPCRPLTGANLERAFASQQRVAWQLYLSGVLDQHEFGACLARVRRLRLLLARGESLIDALAAERALGAPDESAELVPLARQVAEPLSAADAVAQQYGFERERLEQIALRDRLGPKAWRELVVSGNFFRATPAEPGTPRPATTTSLGH